MDIYGKYRGANRITCGRGVFRNKMGCADFFGVNNAVLHGGCALHITFHQQFDILNGGIFLFNGCVIVEHRNSQIRTGGEFLILAVQVDIKDLIGHFHRGGNIYDINCQRGLHHIGAPFTLYAHHGLTGFCGLNDTVFINRYRISHAGIGVFHIGIFPCVVVQGRLQGICAAQIQRQLICFSQLDYGNILIVRNDNIAGRFFAIYARKNLGVALLPAADHAVLNGGNRFVTGLPFNLLALCALKLQSASFVSFHCHAGFPEGYPGSLPRIFLTIAANRRQQNNHTQYNKNRFDSFFPLYIHKRPPYYFASFLC